MGVMCAIWRECEGVYVMRKESRERSVALETIDKACSHMNAAHCGSRITMNASCLHNQVLPSLDATPQLNAMISANPSII